MDTDLITPRSERLSTEIEAYAMAISSLVIRDADEYRAAVSELREITRREKQVDEEYKNLRAPIIEMEDRLRKFFSQPRTLLIQAKSFLKNAIGKFETDEADRVARELAEARRQEDAERRRLQAQAAERERVASAERLAAEAKARSMEQAGNAKAAEKMRAAADDLERLRVADAVRLRVAAELVEAAPVVAAPIASGMARTTEWLFEIKDLALLPREFMVPDDKSIRAYVKARKDHATIPGVRIWSELSIRSTGK